MLSGKIGDSGAIPLLENHRDNLFTLLGDAYSLRVQENITRLCPSKDCPRPQRSTLATGYGLFEDSIALLVPRTFPASLSGHVDGDVPVMNEPAYNRVDELQIMLDELSLSRTENVLFYNHQLLPHAPYRFFPSGAEYNRDGLDGWIVGEYWDDQPWLVLQGYQRYLLQVGFVDTLIGRVLRTLDQAGIYDRSLIVVAADHGVSFRAGDGRRPVTKSNLADITNIPLFVKYPNQLRRGVDSRLVHSVDILPTIADVLGIELPWKVDGVSLLAEIPERDVVVHVQGGDVVHASPDEMIRNRDETLRHKADEFGERRDSLFRIGTNKALLGRDVRGVSERSPTVAVEVEYEETLVDVWPASGFLPARISCHVVEGRLDKGVELAIAVNGRVRGLTTWFWDDEDGVQRFRSLVPQDSFRAGVNKVDVFLVQRRGAHVSLVSIGSSGRES
jgi:Sulfatase